MTTKVNTRQIVLDILLEVLEKGDFSHLVMRQALNKYGYLEKKERAFINRLANGTIEKAIELDYIINQFSKTKTTKMKPVIRNILRMTVYQLKYMDSVPTSAACNEAVKLAQIKGFHTLKGFINGVVRTISRNIEQFQTYDSLSLTYSMPEWLVNYWNTCYGREKTKQILESMTSEYSHQEICVRCNLSNCDLDTIIASLQAQDVCVRIHPQLPFVLYLSQYDYLEGLEAFVNGWIQVQDITSILVGLFANPKKDNICIDVCAAPGGKSLHLADLLEHSGMVESRDLTYDKVSLIEENIERSKFTNIKATVWDATVLDEAMIGKADIVIADLPCSGLGIISNKPDIKYSMTKEKMDDLATLQRQILEIVQQYVKEDGILIYSTCTINPEENEKNIQWFLNQFPFELCSDLESTNVPKEFFDDSEFAMLTEKGYVQLFPNEKHATGFFIAKLKRKNNKN